MDSLVPIWEDNLLSALFLFMGNQYCSHLHIKIPDMKLQTLGHLYKREKSVPSTQLLWTPQFIDLR